MGRRDDIRRAGRAVHQAGSLPHPPRRQAGGYRATVLREVYVDYCRNAGSAQGGRSVAPLNPEHQELVTSSLLSRPAPG